jgi:hypothetical protein
MKHLRLLSILIITVLSSQLKAQDTIYKTNGSKLVVKIMEINNFEIKYKSFDDNNNSVFIENKNNVHHIVYKNGLKEFYNTTTEGDVTHTSIAEKEIYYGKNILAINFFETVFTNFGFSYEHIFPDSKISIKIPVSFGLGGQPAQQEYSSTSDNVDYLRNKIYGTGLELNIYPVKANRSGFYIGLSAEYGKFNYYTSQYYYNYSPYYYATGAFTEHEGTHYAGLFHLGGYLGLTKNILLGAKIAAGYKRQETVLKDYTHFKMNLDLNVAYRF